MVKKESVAWPRGEMRFHCLNGDDRKTERFEKDGGRTWVSGKNETPSMFMVRIVRDMEKDGANIIPYLLDSFETEELIPILDKRECVGVTPNMRITSNKKR